MADSSNNNTPSLNDLQAKINRELGQSQTETLKILKRQQSYLKILADQLEQGMPLCDSDRRLLATIIRDRAERVLLVIKE